MAAVCEALGGYDIEETRQRWASASPVGFDARTQTYTDSRGCAFTQLFQARPAGQWASRPREVFGCAAPSTALRVVTRARQKSAIARN